MRLRNSKTVSPSCVFIARRDASPSNFISRKQCCASGGAITRSLRNTAISQPYSFSSGFSTARGLTTRGLRGRLRNWKSSDFSWRARPLISMIFRRKSAALEQGRVSSMLDAPCLEKKKNDSGARVISSRISKRPIRNRRASFRTKPRSNFLLPSSCPRNAPIRR